MASRASDRWFWRDVRLVYVLLVWAVFSAGLFVYFDGIITLHREASAPPQAAGDDELYTGSIVVVPPQGDHCWQMMLDNRTGRMWDGGYLDCGVIVDALAENKHNGTVRAVRMNAIGAAFRGDGM